jgi:hypothetical protein
MNYTGEVIEESLQSLDLLGQLDIKSSRTEKVTDAHKTPWLEKWTLHTVEVSAEAIEDLAHKLSQILKPKHWYADFKNDDKHVIVFPGKVFNVDRNNQKNYKDAIDHGEALSIPRHHFCFLLESKDWKL